MRLTDLQKQTIELYLRQVGDYVEEQGAPDAASQLNGLRERITGSILHGDDGPVPDDAAVQKAVQSFGSPAVQGGIIAASLDMDSRSEWGHDERRWLGVCAGLAEQSGVPVLAIRLFAVLLGLIMPPLAISIYLVFYFTGQYTGGGRKHKINKARVVKYVVAIVAAAISMRVIASVMVRLMEYTYMRVFEEQLLLVGNWNWLSHHGGGIFSLTLLLFLPVGLLAALPVPKAWRNTLRKVMEAGLALYALGLCFGVASSLAGILTKAAAHIQDPATLDFQAILGGL